MKPIVLASTSDIRRQLLSTASVQFTAEKARVDEGSMRQALESEGVSPRDQADALADLKAAKVASRHQGSLVIGCDQILALGNEVFAKPETPTELAGQLRRLSGKTHNLFSAVVIYEDTRPVWRHIGRVQLTMHQLSPEFIDDYIARNWEELRHCVGGYQLEGEGVRLFSRVTGSYHDVLGLPLVELLSYLTLRGVLKT